MNLPKSLESFSSYLSGYQELLYDGYCGEPIAWWFIITWRLWESKFEELKHSLPRWYSVEFLSDDAWGVIAEKLTPETTVSKYGKINTVITGPRWWMRETIYWKKRFCFRDLNGLQYEGNEDLFENDYIVRKE